MVQVETPNSTDTNTMVRAKNEWRRKQDTDDYKEVKKKDNAKRCKAIRSIKDKRVESKDTVCLYTLSLKYDAKPSCE